MAAMRILIGFVLCLEAAMRWPACIELYSNAGNPMPMYPGTFLQPVMFGAAGTVLGHSLLVVVLFLVAVGWMTRVSLLLAAALLLHFSLLDALGSLTKYSIIGFHCMILLSCTRCGSVWSVDGWVNRKATHDASSPIWPRRLMQILLCSIYLGAAITKLRVGGFAGGIAIEFAMLDPRHGGRAAGAWLSGFPSLLAAMSVGTIIFEMVFPFLIWFPRTRLPLLGVAAAFHVGLAIFLGVGVFSIIMLAALMCFWEPKPVDLVPQHARRLEKQHLISAGLCAFFAAGLVGCGYAIQASSDWYHAFGNREPKQAPRADELANRILKTEPLRLKDSILRVEIIAPDPAGGIRGDGNAIQRGQIFAVRVHFANRHPAMDLFLEIKNPEGVTADPEQPLSVNSGMSTAILKRAMAVGFPLGDYELKLLGTLPGDSEQETLWTHTLELVD